MRKYDIISVDSWHTLACSSLDLFAAWAILRPGGVLVVHDCNPPRFELARPEPPDPYGEWVGVTYQACVEFLSCGLHSRAFTVDADYGVSVVFKGNGAQPPEPGEGRQARHMLPWHLLRENERGRFDYFDRHREELIGLVSPGEFARMFGWPRSLAPAPAAAERLQPRHAPDALAAPRDLEGRVGRPERSPVRLGQADAVA